VTVPGVYSWVPEDVREAILEFCRNTLTNSGIAYISYNAKPGWAIRKVVRELIQRDPSVRKAAIDQKVAKAVEVAGKYREDLLLYDNYPFAVMLADELSQIDGSNPGHIFHEYLCEINDGFWLRDFVDIARRHGLDYVTDAQFIPWAGDVPFALIDSLAKRYPDDPIVREEAADLLLPRTLHASILCQSDAARSSCTRQDLLNKIYFDAYLIAESESVDLTEGAAVRFFTRSGLNNAAMELALDSSIAKAAVILLTACWPKGMRLEKLYPQASELLIANGHEVPKDARSQLSEELKKLFEAEYINMRLKQPVYDMEIYEYPRANALARFEAEHRNKLTIPYHVPLEFEAKAMELVCALDGSRSESHLSRTFGKEFVQKTLKILAKLGLLEQNMSFEADEL
jgi:hypothetical protein